MGMFSSNVEQDRSDTSCKGIKSASSCSQCKTSVKTRMMQLFCNYVQKLKQQARLPGVCRFERGVEKNKVLDSKVKFVYLSLFILHLYILVKGGHIDRPRS